jgi:effector-binding domain-containing protein
MIDPPWIEEMPEQAVAFIPITVARSQIQTVMMPGLSEIQSALSDQGLAPAGPWLTHHHYLKPDVFHFDICVPVTKSIKPQGRVRPGILDARKVARTIHRGPFEQLGQSWGAFMAWVSAQGLPACIDFFECYAKGAEASPDSAQWETELSVPLME